MNVNDRQVAGKHYATKYQHWDMVCDTGMHYLQGCATKYITRWKSKNGIQDLEKAVHYCEKAGERSVSPVRRHVLTVIEQFIVDNNISIAEAKAIMEIAEGEYDHAISTLTALIDQCSAEPTSAYVNQ